MSKGILTLYVDNELKELAKAKLINMSSFFNECLRLEVDSKERGKEQNKIGVLRNKIAMLSGELKEKNKEIAKLQPKEYNDGYTGERLPNGKPRYQDLGVRI